MFFDLLFESQKLISSLIDPVQKQYARHIYIERTDDKHAQNIISITFYSISSHTMLLLCIFLVEFPSSLFPCYPVN